MPLSQSNGRGKSRTGVNPLTSCSILRLFKAEAAFLEQAATRIKRQSASLKRLRAKMELAIDARASAIADTEAFQRDRAE